MVAGSDRLTHRRCAGGTCRCPKKALRAVVVRPAVPRDRLAGGHRRAGGADRLVSGRQYQPEPGGAAHRHRLRLPAAASPASRSANRRSYQPGGRYLWHRADHRGSEHAESVPRSASCWPPSSARSIGIGRLSGNWLLADYGFYVETLRDIPLLLQLLLLVSMLQTLPPPRQSLHIGNAVFLSNRGPKMPLVWQPAHTWASLAFVLGAVGTLPGTGSARRRQEATGVRPGYGRSA